MRCNNCGCEKLESELASLRQKLEGLLTSKEMADIVINADLQWRIEHNKDEDVDPTEVFLERGYAKYLLTAIHLRLKGDK